MGVGYIGGVKFYLLVRRAVRIEFSFYLINVGWRVGRVCLVVGFE